MTTSTTNPKSKLYYSKNSTVDSNNNSYKHGCACCPYGYHIDVDFLQYLDSTKQEHKQVPHHSIKLQHQQQVLQQHHLQQHQQQLQKQQQQLQQKQIQQLLVQRRLHSEQQYVKCSSQQPSSHAVRPSTSVATRECSADSCPLDDRQKNAFHKNDHQLQQPTRVRSTSSHSFVTNPIVDGDVTVVIPDVIDDPSTNKLLRTEVFLDPEVEKKFRATTKLFIDNERKNLKSPYDVDSRFSNASTYHDRNIAASTNVKYRDKQPPAIPPPPRTSSHKYRSSIALVVEQLEDCLTASNIDFNKNYGQELSRQSDEARNHHVDEREDETKQITKVQLLCSKIIAKLRKLHYLEEQTKLIPDLNEHILSLTRQLDQLKMKHHFDKMSTNENNTAAVGNNVNGNGKARSQKMNTRDIGVGNAVVFWSKNENMSVSNSFLEKPESRDVCVQMGDNEITQKDEGSRNEKKMSSEETMKTLKKSEIKPSLCCKHCGHSEVVEVVAYKNTAFDVVHLKTESEMNGNVAESFVPVVEDDDEVIVNKKNIFHTSFKLNLNQELDRDRKEHKIEQNVVGKPQISPKKVPPAVAPKPKVSHKSSSNPEIINVDGMNPIVAKSSVFGSASVEKSCSDRAISAKNDKPSADNEVVFDDNEQIIVVDNQQNYIGKTLATLIEENVVDKEGKDVEMLFPIPQTPKTATVITSRTPETTLPPPPPSTTTSTISAAASATTTTTTLTTTVHTTKAFVDKSFVKPVIVDLLESSSESDLSDPLLKSQTTAAIVVTSSSVVTEQGSVGEVTYEKEMEEQLEDLSPEAQIQTSLQTIQLQQNSSSAAAAASTTTTTESQSSTTTQAPTPTTTLLTTKSTIVSITTASSSSSLSSALQPEQFISEITIEDNAPKIDDNDNNINDDNKTNNNKDNTVVAVVGNDSGDVDQKQLLSSDVKKCEEIVATSVREVEVVESRVEKQLQQQQLQQQQQQQTQQPRYSEQANNNLSRDQTRQRDVINVNKQSDYEDYKAFVDVDITNNIARDIINDTTAATEVTTVASTTASEVTTTTTTTTSTTTTDKKNDITSDNELLFVDKIASDIMSNVLIDISTKDILTSSSSSALTTSSSSSTTTTTSSSSSSPSSSTSTVITITTTTTTTNTSSSLSSPPPLKVTEGMKINLVDVCADDDDDDDDDEVVDDDDDDDDDEEDYRDYNDSLLDQMRSSLVHIVPPTSKPTTSTLPTTTSGSAKVSAVTSTATKTNIVVSKSAALNLTAAAPTQTPHPSYAVLEDFEDGAVEPVVNVVESFEGDEDDVEDVYVGGETYAKDATIADGSNVATSEDKRSSLASTSDNSLSSSCNNICNIEGNNIIIKKNLFAETLASDVTLTSDSSEAETWQRDVIRHSNINSQLDDRKTFVKSRKLFQQADKFGAVSDPGELWKARSSSSDFVLRGRGTGGLRDDDDDDDDDYDHSGSESFTSGGEIIHAHKMDDDTIGGYPAYGNTLSAESSSDHSSRCGFVSSDVLSTPSIDNFLPGIEAAVEKQNKQEPGENDDDASNRIVIGDAGANVERLTNQTVKQKINEVFTKTSRRKFAAPTTATSATTTDVIVTANSTSTGTITTSSSTLEGDVKSMSTQLHRKACSSSSLTNETSLTLSAFESATVCITSQSLDAGINEQLDSIRNPCDLNVLKKKQERQPQQLQLSPGGKMEGLKVPDFSLGLSSDLSALGDDNDLNDDGDDDDDEDDVRQSMLASRKANAATAQLDEDDEDCFIEACRIYALWLDDNTYITESEKDSILDLIRKDWFMTSGRKMSTGNDVRQAVNSMRNFGNHFVENVVNTVDNDGNTTLHYAVSHANAPVIEVLLDTGVCDVNKQNNAGYTSSMLAALLVDDVQRHRPLLKKLFDSGDINAASERSGQTALMLASSHGREDMVSLLLECQADINMQDEDGSTALMCASEHGHINIIKILLASPLCNSSLSDVDGSTALSIAMEEGHQDIGVLIYAHVKAHATIDEEEMNDEDVPTTAAADDDEDVGSAV